MSRSHCIHGNKRSLGICPTCANEAMAKRQHQIDRQDFKRRIASILGRRP